MTRCPGIVPVEIGRAALGAGVMAVKQGELDAGDSGAPPVGPDDGMGLHPAAAGTAAVTATPPLRSRRYRRRWLVAILVAATVLLGLGGYAALGAYGYSSLAVPRHCGDRVFAAETPADFKASNASGSLVADASPYHFGDYRDVSFPARGSSLTIRGWYAPGQSGTATPIVIVGNGLYSCRRDSVTLLPAGMLHAAGFGVLAIDLRNHGDSDVDTGHSALGAKEFADVLGAWDWLVQQGYEPRRIGLFGSSLSGASSLIAMGFEPRVAATWADSSFASVDTFLAEQTGKAGFPEVLAGSIVLMGHVLGEPALGTRSPDRALATLAGRPLAIVHGLADTSVQPHHAADLAAAAARAGTRVEPWLVPGAGHQEAVLAEPAAYDTRLVAFFAGALGGP